MRKHCGVTTPHRHRYQISFNWSSLYSFGQRTLSMDSSASDPRLLFSIRISPFRCDPDNRRWKPAHTLFPPRSNGTTWVLWSSLTSESWLSLSRLCSHFNKAMERLEDWAGMLLSFRLRMTQTQHLGSTTNLPHCDSGTKRLLRHLAISRRLSETSKIELNLVVAALHLSCLLNSS